MSSAAVAPAPDAQQRPPRMAIAASPRHVDREKTCPLLLRVFTKVGGHHDIQEFSVRGKEPKDEVQIYTWPDASLRELTDLVKEVSPLARRREAKLSFAFIYPDRRGRNVMRIVGTVSATRRGPDDMRTLAELSFQAGDFLDVAVLV